MKKLVSIVLALVMVLSLGTVAFAAESDLTSETKDVELFYKEYDNLEVYPAEELTFTSVADGNNPTAQNLTFKTHTVNAKKTTVTVTLPAYTKVGKYNYTITENAGNTQGVTYSTESLRVQVVVTYNDDHTALEATIGALIGVSNKDDTINNTYKTHNLKVKKTISGDLASKDQAFTVKVTLKATQDVKSAITVSGGSVSSNSQTIAAGWTGIKEVSILLKGDDTVTFSNIPDGVTYTVDENDSHAAVDASGSNPATGYAVTGEVLTETALNADASVTINNEKNGGTPDTGITMDTIPYIVVLAVAALGLVAFVANKRRAAEF